MKTKANKLVMPETMLDGDSLEGDSVRSLHMDNGSGILLKIRQRYPSLRESEKKVARFVMNRPMDIIHLSLRELSERIQTSDATIVRFCQAVGFKGFQEFKIAIALDFASPVYNFPEDLLETDDLATIARKIAQNSIRALEASCDKLEIDKLERAVSAIEKARRVEFYGMGGSGIIAQNAHYQFLKIGLKCSAYGDPFLAAISASQLTHEDVAIGISYSGLTKDTIKAVSIAREAGAFTIGITSDLGSPLARICEVVFESVSRELPVLGVAVAARSAQYNIIDILYVATALRRKREALEALKKGGLAVTDKSFLL